MHAAALFPCAQPPTLTPCTAPDEEKVMVADDGSSAPATQDFAPPFTALMALVTAPVGGTSGTFLRDGSPAAGSASSGASLPPPARLRMASPSSSPGPVGTGFSSGLAATAEAAG